MRNNYADTDAHPVFVSDTDTADMVFTISADENQFWCIDWVAWSYDAAPTGGNLLITINGVTQFQIDITNEGPGIIRFDPPLYGEKNQAVVITLANAGVTCALNVRYR